MHGPDAAESPVVDAMVGAHGRLGQARIATARALGLWERRPRPPHEPARGPAVSAPVPRTPPSPDRPAQASLAPSAPSRWWAVVSLLVASGLTLGMVAQGPTQMRVILLIGNLAVALWVLWPRRRP